MSAVGKSSFAIVFFFLLIGIGAPFIANDVPKGSEQSFLPLVKFGPEATNIFEVQFLAHPDQKHFLGTDYVGRDILARLVHAVRNSLFFSIIVVLVSLLIGLTLGAIMGFYGGKTDLILSRIMEIISNFPIFLLQLTFLAFFSSNYYILFVVMIFANWIGYCRYTRAEFMRLKNLEFVQAARALGASDSRLIFRHLLPNALTPLFVLVPFDLSSTIVGLGALSFLGFGEPPNVASFGELLKQAKDHFQQAWWLAVFPGGVLFILTLSLTLLGSSLRDWLDPRHQKSA